MSRTRRRAAVLAVAAVCLPQAAPAADTGPASGEALFGDFCAACHQKSGLGVKGAFPPLAGNRMVQGPADALATAVLIGRGGMPAFRSDLDDAQLAAVLTYLRSTWGNTGGPVQPSEVAAARAKAEALPQPATLDAH